MPNIKQHLTRLDVIVDSVSIPAITDGHIRSADERLLLSLPAKKGGLAIPIFSAVADNEFANSRAATEQLIEQISNQNSTAPMDSEYRIYSINRPGRLFEAGRLLNFHHFQQVKYVYFATKQ